MMKKDDEVQNCSVCGREISEENYKTHDGMCWECWDDAHERRTHPSYLSSDEAARERRRTGEMVRSIVRTKQAARPVESKGTTRVGETDHFIVDFNDEEKLIIVYGKEVPAECGFKLAFDKDELRKIVDLLKKAYDFL
jgi:hypothetical protein